MRKILNYITLAMALLFLACQEKEVLQDEAGNTAVSIEASIAGRVPTKANTEGNGMQWMAEDKIAIRNTAKAEYFTYVYRNDAWGPDGNIYLKWSGNEMTVVAYTPETAKDGNFILPADQSDIAKLRSADFMSTATTTNNVLVYADTLVSRQGESYSINLTMYHRMAKVILNFTSQKNITDLKLNSAYAGFANNEPTGSITAITPLEGVNATTQGQTFTAVVAADENGQAEATFLTLLESGAPYSLKGIPAMQPGYEYTYSLMFNDEKKLSIADVTVTPWVDKGTIGSGTGHKVSYAKRGLWDPCIVKDGDTYYMICSDTKIPGYPYKPGLQVLTSTDLVSFSPSENLFSTIQEEALETFKTYASAKKHEITDDKAVYIGHPFLYKASDGWYILYTIQDDKTPINIIQYSYTNSTNLINAIWNTPTTLLETVYPDGKFRPTNPTFFWANPGDKTYYLGSMEGDANYIHRWWNHRMNVGGGKIGYISNRQSPYLSKAMEINSLHTFYYNRLFEHFFIFQEYNICHAFSVASFQKNVPADYCGTSGTSVTPSENQALNGNVKILTPYSINNGTIWYNTGGAHAFEDGTGNWYMVHHVSANNPTAEPTFHVRSMHWLEPSITGGNQAVPVICPEPYSEADNNPVNTADLIGTWNFGNLKTISTSDTYNAINEKVELFSGGSATYNDKNYTWTYDETTHILTLKLDVTIFMYVQGVTNYDSGKITFAASGVTSDAKNSSYWMEKE